MTTLLTDAVAKASRLPDDDQNSIAALIMEQLEADAGWNSRFATVPHKLIEMGRKALTEHRAGNTTPLDELLG